MIETLPQAPETERAVISAILNEPESFERTVDIITANDFYKPTHGLIYQTMYNLWKNNGAFEWVTVLDALRANKFIDQVGGVESFLAIVNEFRSAANIENHCKEIRKAKKYRDFALLLSSTLNQFDQSGKTTSDIISNFLGKLDEIVGEQTSAGFQTMDTVMVNALNSIQERSEAEGGVTGVPTGISKLNKLTAGWQKSDLIILAAPTKQGKTTLGLNFAKTAAEAGFPTGVFSMEMSSTMLGERFLSNESQVDTSTVHYKKPAAHEWERMSQCCQKLSKLPIIIDASPGLNIAEVSARAKRMKQRFETQLLIVDYIQLMAGVGEKSRQLQVENISRGLKKLAMTLDIPVIAVSQFSRLQKGQEKRRPMLSDLRDSGALEQDANQVLLIHDPPNDRKKEHLDARNLPHNLCDFEKLREIIVAANRQGPTVDILVKFSGEYFRFSDI